MAVRSSNGKVVYGSPILNIGWHKTLNSEQAKLITTDKHIVRILDHETGEGVTSIEPTAGKNNDTCVFSQSGLNVLALASSQIPSYFIPALGPAPKRCSYLENLTEELEEDGQTTIYDDYKFLTKEDLAKLNLTNLIGTNLLRAYMHGFFINYNLYKKRRGVQSLEKYNRRCFEEFCKTWTRRVPENLFSKKYMESDEDDEGRPGKRRGVQSLKIPGLGDHGGGRSGGFRGRNGGRGRRPFYLRQCVILFAGFVVCQLSTI